jgi:hypothetical protein
MWMSLPLGAPPSFPSTPAFGDHLVTPLGKNYTNHHDTHREELQGGARVRAKQRDKGMPCWFWGGRTAPRVAPATTAVAAKP